MIGHRRIAAAVVRHLLLLLLLLLSHSAPPVSALIDPFSVGIVAGLGALGYTGLLKEHTLCRLTECCNDRHIPADVQGK